MSRTASYPSLKELNAAARGLLFLHETYELDWKDTIKGEIAAASLPSGSFNFTSVEKINPIDLPIFAELAFGLNSFDTCIQILRIAWDYIDKYPEDLRNQLEDLKRKVVEMNNQYLVKRDTVIGNKHRTLPYLVGKNLKKKKNQGKKTAKHMVTNLQSPEAQNFFLQTVCRGEGLLNKNMNNQKNLPKCKWLHHFDPYLKLGPIKLEIAKRSPWTVVFHDLLSEKEMNFLIEYSKPRLSRNREVDASNSPGDRADILSGKSRRIVAKTVQCWLNDIVYDHGKDSVFLAEDVHNYVHKDVDDNFNYTVVHPIMYKLSKKIEIATQMNATGKWSATSYQTTNYGLGGLCESHIDPHGHLEGAALPDSRKVN